MAMQRITTSATFFLKDGAGYVRNFSVPAAGTGWTLTLNDIGPAGVVTQVNTFPISVGLALNSPMFFPHGIQIVTAGTAGEIDVDFI